MKIGIVSDIHGNAKMLKRAFNALTDADLWICLGDSINQFKFSNEVIMLLKHQCDFTILGNHEELFFDEQSSAARSAFWIDSDLLAWLKARPKELTLKLSDYKLKLVHSTPWGSGHDYVFFHDDAFSRFGDYDVDIITYGHTHDPLITMVNGTLVINPGSLGEGKVEGDRYTHSFAVLDLPSADAQIIHFTD